jgi:hypothetical protein
MAVPSLADQVVLKNGDRITGAIVKKDDKNLTSRVMSSAPSPFRGQSCEPLRGEAAVVVLPNNRTVLATIAVNRIVL